MKQISIVIPAKNEEHRLPSFLTSIVDYCKSVNDAYEIIVVDDGSTDQTVKQASLFREFLPTLKVISLDRNHGKGYAVKEGFLAAKGNIVLFLDADGSTGPQEIQRYLHLFEQGYDVVIGSRVLTDTLSQVKTRFYRKFMGAVFNFFVSTLLIKGIKDTQCGFKMFKAKAAKDVFNQVQLEGFGFDLEVLYLAQRMGYKIKEVPVNWHHVQGSKVDIFKDSMRMFLNILEIKRIHQ